MKFSALDNSLWLASVAGEVALCLALFLKGRWRSYPIFTSLVLLQPIYNACLYLFYSHGMMDWYKRIYLAYLIICFLQELAVIYEIARVVLRPTGTWVRDARKQFALSAAGGCLVALALAFMVAPPAQSTINLLAMRGNLFTSLLICESFVAMTMASNRLGLGWRSHVMAIAQGLTVCTTVAVIVDALHSYFGDFRYYLTLEHLGAATYIGTLAYWSVQLWREEPVRQPLSADLQRYIVALHRRVQYDLGEVER